MGSRLPQVGLRQQRQNPLEGKGWSKKGKPLHYKVDNGTLFAVD